MRKELRVKLQSQEDTKKFKYTTTYDVKLGDTLTFKWNKAWTVVKILKSREGQSDILVLGFIGYLVLIVVVVLCIF